MSGRYIYHICKAEAWAEARAAGVYRGSPLDRRDGFIHFSAAEQLRETADLHLTGQEGLVLLVVEAASLGEALVWESSRGDALFPHLYAPLPVEAVAAVHELPLGPDGRHAFPPLPA